MVFYENKIYQNNQSQICIVAFQYPRNRCFFKRTDFPSMCFQGWRKILLFQYLYDKIHVLLYKKLVYKKLSTRTFKKNFFFKTTKETASFTRLGIYIILFPSFAINFHIKSFPIIVIIFVVYVPANNYQFKINSRYIRKRCEICSEFTINKLEKYAKCCFEHYYPF